MCRSATNRTDRGTARPHRQHVPDTTVLAREFRADFRGRAKIFVSSVPRIRSHPPRRLARLPREGTRDAEPLIMLKLALLAFTLLLVTPSNGCVRRGSVAVSARVSTAPRLVWIAPGVWVVEDWDRAIFFADGYYWWFSGDIWYRSDYYTGGFVAVRVPPPRVADAYRPRVYVRYHAPRGAQVRVIGPRGTPPPKVRDHRRTNPPPGPPPKQPRPRQPRPQ